MHNLFSYSFNHNCQPQTDYFETKTVGLSNGHRNWFTILNVEEKFISGFDWRET